MIDIEIIKSICKLNCVQIVIVQTNFYAKNKSKKKIVVLRKYDANSA